MTLNIIKKIETLAKEINRDVVIMELCGTHTEAVAKNASTSIFGFSILNFFWHK